MHLADTPLDLPCGRRIPGRIALAPLTNLQSQPDGTLGEDELAWMARRATGGFGLLSTCAAYVSEQGHAWEGQLGISEAAHLPGLRRLAEAMKAGGALAVVQLHHGGRLATVAPGARLSTADDPDANVRGASRADLELVVADFAAAACRAEQAGFDGVELHGANGYLFTQFLAPADNPRTDAYGGPVQNRARLLLDTLDAVRAAVSPRFVVGVRLSPVDTWARRGLVLHDGLQVARWLADGGADFVHLSLRDAAGPPPFEPGGPVVARAFRDALPAEVALLSAGGVWTEADALRAHEAGADVVVVGRAAIAHPDLPRAWRDPAFDPVRPPWEPARLHQQAVGPAFVAYLSRMRGMVVGGA